MARAEITREGVLNAVAEFDEIGRERFLEQYGFNRARDYFLIHQGRRYDSKAIVAVAHKWAPDGDGRALTALGLSGGRYDAAKRLRDLGFVVTDPEPETPAKRSESTISEQALRDAFARFQQLIVAREGHPFRNFEEGIAAAWEGYKPRLRTHARDLLAAEDWTRKQIGSGQILERTIHAIEIQDNRINLINNLVFWQNRYGHANRDHRALLEAQTDPGLRRRFEHALFELYRGDEDEGALFDELSALSGAKYPLLAYLYFLKDMDRFMPIQPTGFDEALRSLQVDLVTLRSCTWENYQRFNATLAELQHLLMRFDGLTQTRLIDAHSFCWLLVKLPFAKDSGEATRAGSGRVVGGREKSIIAMRYSIENTVRNANGQIVERTLKNKELKMSSQELEVLLARLLDLQGNRCALTGIPFHFHGPDADRNLLPSPDRIDSNGHYEIGNLQVVCQFINFWKGSMEVEEFRRLLMLVRDREDNF